MSKLAEHIPRQVDFGLSELTCREAPDGLRVTLYIEYTERGEQRLIVGVVNRRAEAEEEFSLIIPPGGNVDDVFAHPYARKEALELAQSGTEMLLEAQEYTQGPPTVRF